MPDNQETLSHYKEVAEQSEIDRHNRILSKVQACMGNAEFEGEDQDLICQLMIEEGPLEPLMNIVANVSSDVDPSFNEVQYAVGSVKDFLTALENRLYKHFSD
jgi:hypothetical protein